MDREFIGVGILIRSIALPQKWSILFYALTQRWKNEIFIEKSKNSCSAAILEWLSLSKKERD
jgi:hypothetical protein